MAVHLNKLQDENFKIKRNESGNCLGMAVTKVCGGGVQLVGRVLRKAAAAHGFCVALVQHTTCHSFISHNDALGADYRFIWPITKLLGSRGTNANGVHIP
jgi:hypothetical protein